MIGEFDMNTFDVVGNLNPILLPDNFVNPEDTEAIEQVIKDQYINFNNLGVNLINDVNDEFKKDIFADMLNYINENYMSIGDLDACSEFPLKLLEIGNYIYSFICVDCYNTIIPNFLTLTDCMTLESFDTLIRIKYRSNYSLVKANLIKTIKTVVEELLKLQRIDKSIQQEKTYQNILMKYTYYIDLADFGDTEKFVENYMRPMLEKNFDSIIWRII